MLGATADANMSRYGRQLILKDWGKAAQSRLAEKNVLLVGVGGTGSTVALYLVSAGIGKLGIVDGDMVDLTNLHRQIIHNEARVGMNKAESARHSCLQLNHQAIIEVYTFYMTAEVAPDIIPKYDVIIDATDNPQSRYLLNDAAVLYGKPLVTGSALHWEGQFCVYNWDGGPCYRCIFPRPPPSDSIKSCDMEGVIGPAPGIIGVMQSLEALKICGGLTDKVLKNKLLAFDGLNPINPWQTYQLRSKRSNCEICGENPTITYLEESYYKAFCPQRVYPQLETAYCIDPSTFLEQYGPDIHLNNRSNSSEEQEGHRIIRVVDVRPPSHYSIGHLDYSYSWPIDELCQDLKEAKDVHQLLQNKLGIEPTKQNGTVKIVCVCRKGNESAVAAQKLIEAMNQKDALRSMPYDIMTLTTGLLGLKQLLSQLLVF